MSEAAPRRGSAARFSLGNLLTLTALVALGVAVGLAVRRNRLLIHQRDELLSLSSRLPPNDQGELVSAAMPAVAADFHSWHVHVPSGQPFELRLGIGAISENGIPPIVGSARIPAGQHRVTLHAEDSSSDEFRYAVYVDGALAFEKTMGKEWLPSGWSSASSVNWPRVSKLTPPPLQLASRSYTSRQDFGDRHYFNGQNDSYVTRSGYRLWIDRQNRTYQPTSPFMGFAGEPQHDGIGLRDGVRYRASSQPYEWAFTRPALATMHPVLRVEAEFVATDGTVLSSKSQEFQAWRIRDASSRPDAQQLQDEPAPTTFSAFLQAVSKSAEGLQPVVEMRWDTSRPDAVGLRLADTAANGAIGRWRLRVLDGSHHLWRELQIGARPWLTPADALDALDADAEDSKTSIERHVELDLGDPTEAEFQLRWQTNESLPLQIVERNDKRFASGELYKGLPVSLGIQVPAAMQPKFAVEIADAHPAVPDTALPGGPVFDALQFEFETAKGHWIWLSAKPRE